MRKALNCQLDMLRDFQRETGSLFGHDLKYCYQDYKRKEEELRKLRKRQSKDEQEQMGDCNSDFNTSSMKLNQLVLHYMQYSKIGNILPGVIVVMKLHEQDYKKLAKEVDQYFCCNLGWKIKVEMICRIGKNKNMLLVSCLEENNWKILLIRGWDLWIIGLCMIE